MFVLYSTVIEKDMKHLVRCIDKVYPREGPGG